MKPALFIGLLLLIPLVAAYDSLEATAITLDWVNFIMSLACIALALFVVGKTGAVLGRAFVFITMSIIFFGGVRLFLYMSEISGTLILTPSTIVIWWHILFYVAAALFIAALQSLKSFGSGYTKEKLFTPAMAAFFLLLILFGIGLFISAKPLDVHVHTIYNGSTWDHLGIIHFIAFVMMGYATYLLISVKHLFGKTVTNAVAPFFVTAACFSLVHLWELITESWKWIILDDLMIETVEGGLFLIALIGIYIATWQIKKAL